MPMKGAKKAEYMRKWAQKNREKVRAYHRQYGPKYYAENIVAQRKYQREWKRRNPAEREKSRVRMKALRDADPAAYRAYQRKRDGLPEPLRAEPAVCDICGLAPRGRSLCLDHDHETGKFRGWLCGMCNRSLGAFGDSVPGLMRAIRYLQNAELL